MIVAARGEFVHQSVHAPLASILSHSVVYRIVIISTMGKILEVNR